MNGICIENPPKGLLKTKTLHTTPSERMEQFSKRHIPLWQLACIKYCLRKSHPMKLPENFIKYLPTNFPWVLNILEYWGMTIWNNETFTKFSPTEILWFFHGCTILIYSKCVFTKFSIAAIFVHWVRSGPEWSMAFASVVPDVSLKVRSTQDSNDLRSHFKNDGFLKQG